MSASRWLSFLLAVTLNVILVSSAPHLRADDFSFVILHNNDMHGRFEETERNTGSCQKGNRNNTCIGGMARTAHVIRAYRQRAKESAGPPVLYLNAGDTFVGTTWFSLFTWNISSSFINLLKPDALSLGNHEFDLTEKALAPFISNLDAPVLAANLNFSQEPTLAGKVNGSTIVQLSGRQVGIIGYLTPETIKVSQVGKVTFEDEVPAVRREAEALAAQGVNIIIALGHSGYNMDQTIAREVELVDIVVGGHTNTFLWNGAQPDSELIQDLYPKVITQESGKQVPVVQAYAYTKYLGVLNCSFDSNGDLTAFAGQPLLMSTSIPQEADLLQLLDVYRPAIDALNEEIIGYSRVFLDGDNWNCRHQECNLGNLVADALVSYATSESTDRWSSVPIGLYNGGGIRNSITPQGETGAVSRGDLIAVLPFGNQVVELTLKGSDLLQAIEQMVRSQGETSSGEFPQVSGLRLVVDMNREPYSRVLSLKARCGICDVPVYETVVSDQNYTLVTSSFLADGGDGITVLSDKYLNKRVMDLGDLDATANYITKYTPIYPEIQGRIRVQNSTVEDNDEDSGNAGSRMGSSWMLLMLVCLLLPTVFQREV
ncbi:protein 5NUC [Dendroctonus ponderosae]|uniref:protein 5NUC n=1 Tax=Dendroctonus ponderosae TaxID=77166 RepID=UPI002034FD6F|nr:protein 5NUC [Dendroctonus ponderosae]KAH1025741.1 hypothetical protein HUJ05_010408 [Dendroctonus ponderosae]KAH1025742.1 hypothetical protein HUJ05_010408 [Dendroctonus ponderosae]